MAPDVPRRPVLVADDEEQLLRLCERVLGRSGYPVLVARDGDELARLFAAHRGAVGAVVIDATLPPQGAADVLETMGDGGVEVGVILTSGAELDERLHTLRAACSGVFLRKPFSASALVRAVEDVQRRADR